MNLGITTRCTMRDLGYIITMAQRRMFSPDIVDSDAFLEMPLGAQLLYFHLGMRADDDGFIGNPRKIQRMVGANDDDLKILLAKRFLLSFQSGVVVIKHWLIHNLIRKDRYKATRYTEEKNLLIVKENGAYTEMATTGVPNGNRLAPQVRLGKVSIGKNTDSAPKARKEEKKPAEFTPLGADLIKEFESVDPKNKRYYANKTQRRAADFLIAEYGFDEVMKRVKVLPMTNKVPYFPKIYTPFDLQEKWGKLQDAVEQERAKKKSGNNFVL